jgi:hypothetical protein
VYINLGTSHSWAFTRRHDTCVLLLLLSPHRSELAGFLCNSYLRQCNVVGGGNPQCFGTNPTPSTISRCCGDPDQSVRQENCFTEWPEGEGDPTFETCCTPGIQCVYSIIFPGVMCRILSHTHCPVRPSRLLRISFKQLPVAILIPCTAILPFLMRADIQWCCCQSPPPPPRIIITPTSTHTIMKDHSTTIVPEHLSSFQ